MVADYYSKFPVVLDATQQIFPEHGVLENIITDDGLQFASTTHKAFTEEWDFSMWHRHPVSLSQMVLSKELFKLSSA